MSTMDRRLVTILVIVCLLILLAFALDHILFPTLPVPAGAPAITK